MYCALALGLNRSHCAAAPLYWLENISDTFVEDVKTSQTRLPRKIICHSRDCWAVVALWLENLKPSYQAMRDTGCKENPSTLPILSKALKNSFLCSELLQLVRFTKLFYETAFLLMWNSTHFLNTQHCTWFATANQVDPKERLFIWIQAEMYAILSLHLISVVLLNSLYS